MMLALTNLRIYKCDFQIDQSKSVNSSIRKFINRAALLSSMLVLALDTTTRTGSVALARDGVVIGEEASDPSKPQAARLPGELIALLDRADVVLREVDACAVATGPGSFTGLRIGIAAMQGLAFAEGKALIGVSALDALALLARSSRGPADGPAKAGPHGRTGIATWVDAWRGDVYAALYEDGRATGEPIVAKPEDLLRDLRGRPAVGAAGEVIFIGDGAATYRDLIVSTLGDAARIADPATPLLAGAIAQLASEAYAAGARPAPHAIRPLYVRRPDAELARKRNAELHRFKMP